MEVSAKHFFWEEGRRRKSRERNLKISTFWLSQVLVCLEAQYDAINEQQSSTFSAYFPCLRQMCWQHGTFFKGTQFYGSWSLSKVWVATSFFAAPCIFKQNHCVSCQIFRGDIRDENHCYECLANASFYPDPFQISMHAKISFSSLGKHSYRHMYLTCKPSFFSSYATHVLFCLAFILFLLDVYSHATQTSSLSLCAFTSHKIHNAALSSLIPKPKKQTNSKLKLSGWLNLRT